jgi:CubicO group peptidase (beta-lactamase class C family)
MRAITTLILCRLAAQDFTPVEQSARDELARANVPGASMAIVRGEQVVFSKAFGTANVETRAPVRREMLFRLGSTTKMLTAAALAGLAAEGKIDLNAPVGKYVPGLPPRIGAVTADQLLSHTAGVLDTTPMYGPHDDDALGKGIRSWTDEWLFTAPGQIFSYSNPGYWLAGYLVEVLTGKPFADAMEARVFRPLEMSRTTLRPTMAMTWPLAIGHEEAPGNTCVVTRPAADNAASWPAGSVFSNTADLAKFTIAFLNARGLDPKVIAMLSAPHASYPDSKDRYGYGLTIRDLRGVPVVEHSGARVGYGSFIRMAPQQRVAIIVQTNRTGGNLPATIERASELMLPLAPRTDPPAQAALRLTEEDLRRIPGRYRNGEQSLEITARDGRLFIKRGRQESELVKHSSRRFSNYVIDGDYVTAGSRSYARAR